MATKTVLPTKSVEVDDRAGNHYSILTVTHNSNSGADTTDVIVPDSVVSVAELPTSGTGVAKADLTIANPTSGASGIGFTFQAGDGVQVVRFAATVADGTYTIVVRHIGSASGIGTATGQESL